MYQTIPWRYNLIIAGHDKNNNEYKYERINQNIDMGNNTIVTHYYQIPEQIDDYDLLTNSCVTTTLNAIYYGFNADNANEAAKWTLQRLKSAVSPREVDDILQADYKAYGGNGLVSYIIQ